MSDLLDELRCPCYVMHSYHIRISPLRACVILGSSLFSCHVCQLDSKWSGGRDHVCLTVVFPQHTLSALHMAVMQSVSLKECMNELMD